MFCPRCGSQNTDTTKFCRQCGLPMTQVTGYVSTGGTSQLVPQGGRSNPLEKVTAGLNPKQKMVLKILLFVFSPAILAAMGLENLAPIAGVLMIIGIVWSVFSYKAEVNRGYAPPPPLPPQAEYLPPLPPQAYQEAPPPTNRFAGQPQPSVIEDETRKLPNEKAN